MGVRSGGVRKQTRLGGMVAFGEFDPGMSQMWCALFVVLSGFVKLGVRSGCVALRA